MKEVYLDNSATTRAYPEVGDLVRKVLCEDYGNPSSMHRKGVEAEKYIKEAKETFAKLLKVQEKEIFFTSGGTESDNLALIGAAKANRRAGNHLIASGIEHPAIINTMRYLEEEGFRVTFLPVDRFGRISLDALKDALCEDTILVSVMYVNNEVGSVQPIQEAASMVKAYNKNILFHVDAVQGFGKYHIYPKRLKVDMCSISGHKIHGPKGIGVLYVRKGVPLFNLIEGGAQERGRRAGTENIPAIVGMAAALKEAVANMDENMVKIAAMRDRLIEGLSTIEHSRLNGDAKKRLPGNVNFCFEGIEGESLLLLLDEKGIEASSGSACTSGSLDPSHVLLAIGLPHEVAHGSLRLTLCEENTPEQIEYIIKEVPGIVSYLRDISPIWEELEKGEKKHVI